MIFVTVGTHEQQFNRLIKYIDDLKKKDIIKEEVVIQTGFSTYEPHYCIWKKLYPYPEMKKLVEKARIVITHGGPSSFILPLQQGKIPIVVPRKKIYNEHVNDHQVDFSKTVAERQKNILVIENIEDIKDVILNYDDIVASMSVGIKNNNAIFNEKFKNIVDELFKR